ncbi:MAG: enoyl-CoA hydratase/isomerase family protein [Oscillospiraceae bacterium]|nr:enoyl-CoA hydratase/isomerase family protein [Oscillospiraceae bacterium]
MSEPRVIAERPLEAPGVLYLTFSNPDAFNSVTVEMREELIRQFTEAEKDDTVRVIVLQGAGDRCFCSGLSMDMLVDMNSLEDRYIQWDVGKRCREAMEHSTKIVVAAVKGSCAGNGLEFVLCCDLVYCADNTKFVLPEFNIGLTPGCGGAISLHKHIPYHRFMEMVLFCDRMYPDEAKHYGFVNDIFPIDTFDDEVKLRMIQLSKTAPLAVKGLKEQFRIQETLGFEAAYRKEMENSLKLMDSNDFKNAVMSFINKENPIFYGN